MTINITPKYFEQAEAFFNVYSQGKGVVCPDKKPNGMKQRSERVCRFCGKKAGEVKFKKHAHIIPEGLGNKHLVSDFECDECNHKFGRYEDDLIKYLGVIRTITKTVGKKNVPQYRGPNFQASKQNFYGNPDAIKLESKGQDGMFEYDAESNQQTIRIKKPPYTPINVYKALLKMSLCLIDEADIPDYSTAFQFLASDQIDELLQGGFVVVGFRLPNAYDNPFGMLFRKNNDNINATTHTFILFYKSMMLQIYLPFNPTDIKHYRNLDCPYLPPLFDGTGDEKWVDHGRIYENLSSTDVKVDGEDIITFNIDPEDLRKFVCFDPAIKQFVDKKFNFSDVASIIMVNENFSISNEQLLGQD